MTSLTAIVARDFRGVTLYIEHYIPHENQAPEFSWTNDRAKAMKFAPGQAIEVARAASKEWLADAYTVVWAADHYAPKGARS